AGCDVILFADDAELDYSLITAALEDGRLSWERVDEAVTRQLALKAALGLHRPQDLPTLDAAGNAALSETAARRAPTLVKDTQALLPISPERHKRVLVFSTGV